MGSDVLTKGTNQNCTNTQSGEEKLAASDDFQFDMSSILEMLGEDFMIAVLLGRGWVGRGVGRVMRESPF